MVEDDGGVQMDKRGQPLRRGQPDESNYQPLQEPALSICNPALCVSHALYACPLLLTLTLTQPPSYPQFLTNLTPAAPETPPHPNLAIVRKIPVKRSPMGPVVDLGGLN